MAKLPGQRKKLQI